MNIRNIVKNWLIDNDYDGLSNLDLECGCTLDDLMPCEICDQFNCQAGYIRKARWNESYWSAVEYIVTPDKPSDKERINIGRFSKAED